MDSLTQAVLGIAVAHTGFSNKINRKKTVFFGAVVATLPDLDIYLAKFFNDPLTEIELHRGFSHSLLFFLLLAAIISKLFKNSFDTVSFKRMYFTTFLILLTHSLLDVFTTWGTQILWWYPEKFALKSIFVVDFFYTFPLLVGVMIGLKRRKLKFTYCGLLVSSLYLGWGLLAQSNVKKEAQQQFSEVIHQEIQQITVKPTFSNSILWNVIIETKDGFYLSDRSLFDNEPMAFQYFPNRHYLIDELKTAKNIQRLITISENQYIITQNENGLVFNDLRFGLLKNEPDDVQFAFSYQLVPQDDDFIVKELPKENRDGKQLLKNIWNRIF
ncbi:MAG TPA: metal-dependent hydrolase [Flavobacterium sp.]|nr:metal-dependent hydrolase [Flavobacterium sp.]